MCFFETKKVFADMQTKDNFIKTIEIMKEDSLFRITMDNLTDHTSLGSDHCMNENGYKGLLTVNMEIVDCDCYYQPHIELQHSEKKHNYTLVFEGFHRIKVSELNYLLDEKTHHLIGTQGYIYPEGFPENYHGMLEDKDFIDDYLKDEEYCIVYFINKEETFKANGWELK